jgi:hypothetical protein
LTDIKRRVKERKRGLNQVKAIQKFIQEMEVLKLINLLRTVTKTAIKHHPNKAK